MPSIYQFKPRFQQLLAPILTKLAAWRISPNQITIFTIALSLVYGLLLALYPGNSWLWVGVPFFMLIRMALNAIDGMLANATGQKTRMGALLNEMGDQISDVTLYCPFALIAAISAPLLVLVVIIALLAEFAGVLAVCVGATRRFDGPMGKSDRAACFGLLALLIASEVAPIWLNGLLGLMLCLLVLTIFNRLQSALNHDGSEQPKQ